MKDLKNEDIHGYIDILMNTNNSNEEQFKSIAKMFNDLYEKDTLNAISISGLINIIEKIIIIQTFVIGAILGILIYYKLDDFKKIISVWSGLSEGWQIALFTILLSFILGLIGTILGNIISEKLKKKFIK